MRHGYDAARLYVVEDLEYLENLDERFSSTKKTPHNGAFCMNKLLTQGKCRTQSRSRPQVQLRALTDVYTTRSALKKPGRSSARSFRRVYALRPHQVHSRIPQKKYHDATTTF